MAFSIACLIPLYGDSEAAGLSRAITGTLYQLGKQLDVICDDTAWDGGSVELDPQPYPNCIEHARNNLVRLFLAHPRQYTHALLWDSDVKPKTAGQIAPILTKLLKADKAIIGVPYIQKMHFWKQGAQAALEYIHAHPEATAEQLAEVIHGYSVRYVPDFRCEPLGEVDAATGLVEMPRHVPFGFALVKREVFEKMTAYYKDSLRYDKDFVEDGKTVHEEHVGLFHTGLERRVFTMEDVAFCDRWRAMGGRLHLYVGEGAPLEHIGATSFSGTREALLDAAFWERNRGF